MRKGKKEVFFIVFLFIIFLTINFISSAVQQVVVNQPTEEQKPKSWFNLDFLGSPIFWFVIGILLLILLIMIGLFFLVRWLIKFLKQENDIFYQARAKKIKLSKIQGRYNSKHWLKVHKNTPIRLVNKKNGKTSISEPIGWHRGDYITHEGNSVISLNLRGNKKWFFFPITDMLVIPLKEKIEITQRDAKGKAVKVIIDNLPHPDEIVQFNQNEILIYAESLSNTGLFYVPVLKSKNGKIIDLSMPVYQSLRDVVVEDYLYTQTDEFTKLSKKAITMNPNLNYSIKDKDSSSSVEVPQNPNKS